MYESTPQHVIDEESFPGLLADMLGSSSSSDTSSSSNDTDSDGSSGSNTTAKRIKRVLRGRRRRKSSVSSKDTPSMPSAPRSPSVGTHNNSFETHPIAVTESTAGYFHSASHSLGAITSGDEADTDGEHDGRPPGHRDAAVNFRDFESEKGPAGTKSPESKRKKKSKRKHRKASRHETAANDCEKIVSPSADNMDAKPPGKGSEARVGLVQSIQAAPESSPKNAFNIRGLSVRSTVPKMLSSTVFSAANPTGPPPTGGAQPGVSVPPAPYGLRRTNSLPDRLNQAQPSAPSAPSPFILPVSAAGVALVSKNDKPAKKYVSRTTAIILLLVSTALVAVCAEFLVSSINYLVDNTGVSQAFVGLIILPIVGNAAEHVTAVTVASKNKMDLAIGVAVGSSIQIALFVTPVIVLLGWILGKDMSLYFTLFETVSLFVSAFIVNFLVLDGRSNYLEGALLIAAYVIIAVAAFFYPDSSQQSTVGGAGIGARVLSKML